MPIPNLSDQLAGRDLGLGIPALSGSNQMLAPNFTPNLLRSGTEIIFIDAAGVPHTALMGNVAGTSINVTLPIAGRPTEFTGIPYSDSAGSPAYTWRFPSDG